MERIEKGKLTAFIGTGYILSECHKKEKSNEVRKLTRPRMHLNKHSWFLYYGKQHFLCNTRGRTD
ncbi:hypothetical protein AM233_02805 [Bacillus sp. FJAT-22058]|nr:hypothetical protein AM233_02805 [Bacillus sp. FJAT-22058]